MDPIESLSTPERVRQICEMGFTPSTSATAMRINNGDVTQTVNWLITNGAADDELVPQTAQISRAVKDQPTDFIDTVKRDGDSNLDGDDASPTKFDMSHAAAETATSVNNLRSPSKVQVVIPAKSPIPATETSQKPHKRKMATTAPTSTKQPKVALQVEKKRSRGRPKKAAKASSPENVIPESEAQYAAKHEQGTGTSSHPVNSTARSALGQKQADMDTANTTTPKLRRDPEGIGKRGATGSTISARVTPEPGNFPDRPEVEPITPERVKKPAFHERPASSKAKVPHRVGLSKRARIAPLLRTVKK